MNLQVGLRRFFSSRYFWGVVSLAAGVTCWIVGDGHSAGVNPPIPEYAKKICVLVGWLYVIDGVRMLRGSRSFMRYVYLYGFYTLCFIGMLSGAAWVYNELSMKALVGIGMTVAIALLVSILRELRTLRALPRGIDS